MVCQQCQELISDYIDGTLELGEQTKMENHLADCEGCRAMRDDLLQVVHFSRQLPLHTPSSAVWARIETDLEAQRPRSSWSRAAAWWTGVQNRYLRLSIPQLAAASVALAIVVSIGVMLARQNSRLRTLQTSFRRASTKPRRLPETFSPIRRMPKL